MIPLARRTGRSLASELGAELHLAEDLARIMLSTVCTVIAQHLSPGQTASARRSMPADLRELFPGP